MSNSSRKRLHENAGLGANEQRTEPYIEYGEGAAQTGTPPSVSSSASMPGSARQQGRAMQAFALIDCNNFFVSCEKLFRPDLEGRPVVVLSSNDGCAVARSNEARAIGIPMASPYFKYRELYERHNVVKFSANFELYGDISRRITDLLATVTPRIEVYSIDESFLDLSQLPISDHDQWAHMVRQRIQDWVGVPVSVGVATSKTLAKIAVERAKKTPAYNGAINLIGNPDLNEHLAAVPIQDVWGVGRRLAPKLKAVGIFNALQLANARPQLAQSLMGIHGRQMVAELNGISCYPLQREDKPRQSIARTRTFGEDTGDSGVIEAALASFTARAAFRLRQDGQLTRKMGVFAQNNKHKPGFKSWKSETYFNVPTADTGKLIETANNLLHDFYQTGIAYHRAGVYLWDFVNAKDLQTDLFGVVNIDEENRSQRLMQSFDAINERWGRHTLHYAAEELGHNWEPRRKLRSPRYVSNWNELPKVRSN